MTNRAAYRNRLHQPQPPDLGVFPLSVFVSDCSLKKATATCADDKSMFRLMDLRKNVYAVRCFRRCIIASNATPPIGHLF